MLWFDSAYEENVEQPQRKPRLHRTRALTSEQLTQLADKIAHRSPARRSWKICGAHRVVAGNRPGYP